MSRRPTSIAAFALVACVFFPKAGAQDVLDGIAAVVNEDVITFSQVRDLVGPIEKAARDQFKGNELVEKIKDIRLKAINDLIDRQLTLQEFKKQKYNIPEHFVDDRIATIVREEFGGDRAAFSRTLQAQGFTVEKFKQAETEKMIVSAMRGQMVYELVEASVLYMAWLRVLLHTWNTPRTVSHLGRPLATSAANTNRSPS